MTAKYESMMIFSLKNGEENVATLVEKFKALIEKNGTVESVDEWGKRKLAYSTMKLKATMFYTISKAKLISLQN